LDGLAERFFGRDALAFPGQRDAEGIINQLQTWDSALLAGTTQKLNAGS